MKSESKINRLIDRIVDEADNYSINLDKKHLREFIAMEIETLG